MITLSVGVKIKHIGKFSADVVLTEPGGKQHTVTLFSGEAVELRLPLTFTFNPSPASTPIVEQNQ